MISGHVAGLIRNGDAVEVGIGRLGAAVLEALADHRNLTLWGGLITPSLCRLLEDGAVSRSITTGIALGDAEFYRWAGARRDIAFRPVEVTHDPLRLGAILRFVAVNFVTSVDLFGQADAETVSGRQVSGPGGLVDFARGALASPGGRSILALPATGAKGSVSRIVPRLGEDGIVTLGRGDADLVVTENGIASLRDASLDERAERLIAIADPHFRDGLEAAWRDIRHRL